MFAVIAVAASCGGASGGGGAATPAPTTSLTVTPTPAPYLLQQVSARPGPKHANPNVATGYLCDGFVLTVKATAPVGATLVNSSNTAWSCGDWGKTPSGCQRRAGDGPSTTITATYPAALSFSGTYAFKLSWIGADGSSVEGATVSVTC